MELCWKTFKFLIKNEVFLVFLLAIFYKNGPYLTIDDLEENQKIFLDQFVLSNKNTIYVNTKKKCDFVISILSWIYIKHFLNAC